MLKKIALILLVTTFPFLTCRCYSQFELYNISGSWNAVKGELVSSLTNGKTEIKKIDVRGVYFLIDTKTLRITKAFDNFFSKDTVYYYAFMDTIPKERRYWHNMRIKFYDEHNLVFEIKYPGYYTADRVMWYNIYLKRK